MYCTCIIQKHKSVYCFLPNINTWVIMGRDEFLKSLNLEPLVWQQINAKFILTNYSWRFMLKDFNLLEIFCDYDIILTITRYFLPVKIVNRTCDIFLLLPAFLFFCCVCVADKNTRALLLHAYCYCLATRRLAVTHHPTYTQHEKREAKEKWQRRQTVENRTYGKKTLFVLLVHWKLDLAEKSVAELLSAKTRFSI